MNEFKGTPGPWIKREIEGAFHKQKAYAIDYNEDQEQVVDYVYREEDANLIAAAPELLEALAAASKKLEDVKSTFHGGFYTGRELYTDLFAKIDGALAKALGK
ncbi:hypothetical protein D3C81_1513990 [compost metagenome]